jgi:rhodanese-related sulfurtransferase
MSKIRRGILLLLLLLAAGCSSETQADEGRPWQASAQEAKKLIDEGKVHVIDVRTPEEFKEGHIPGAKLIPLQELEARMNELSKDQAYLLVCRSGSRSGQAQDLLAKHGYNQTYNMLQGMSEWPYETVKP